MNVLVPSSTLDKHSVDVATVIRLLADVGMRNMVQEFKLEAQFVDCDDMLSCVILEGAR